MRNNTDLLSKSGLATAILARKFICIDKNKRIKTVTQYSKELGVSRGTIQNSIKFLSENNAISLKSKGHLGTFLIKKDLEILLNISGLNFIIGAMPLPYSKRYQGLSTAIIQSIENNLNIPINMAYMRGSKNRVEMVMDQRYDFAITSKYAALEIIKNEPDLEIALELKANSFLSKHVLMYIDKNFNEIADNMTAGIDKDSVDQETLTHLVCKGKKIKFIDTTYNQLIENLESEKIDFAVWNGDELKDNHNKIYTKDLDINDSINTIAVIVVNKNRIEIKKILKDFIDINFVENIQNKVINNLILPKY